MTSDDLTKSQAKAIREALFPGVNYLVRLKTRMEKSGFPGDDKLYQLVCEAYEASWRLSMEVHYLSCDGVGRPSRTSSTIEDESAES
jgi:hypothetical protein